MSAFIFAYISFISLLFIYFNGRSRAKEVLPGDVFMLIFGATYGPWGFTRLYTEPMMGYIFAAEKVTQALIIYGTMCFSLGVGLLLWRTLIYSANSHRVGLAPPLSHAGVSVTFKVLILSALAMMAAYLSVPSIRHYIGDAIVYLRHNSVFSYSELRRIVYADDFWIQDVVSRGRYTVAAGIFCLIIVIMGKRRNYLVIASVVLPLFFIVTSITFHKMTYFVFFIYCILIFYKIRVEHRFTFIAKFIFGLLATLALAVFMLVLYFVQYRDVASVDSAEREGTAIHRTFEAHPLALVIYADVFPSRHPFLYGASNRQIARLTGREYVNAPAVAAEKQGAFTTFQPGFVGDAFADFGLWGVVIYSIFVAFILVLIDRVYFGLPAFEFRAAFFAHAGMNSAWLIWSPAIVALVTGGVGFTIVGYALLGRIFPRSYLWPANKPRFKSVTRAIDAPSTTSN